MRTLALIPARGGSKGIPQKNQRLLRGLSLLAHAIKVGQETCDRTVVTTEDETLADIAIANGAAIITRPAHLATDETPMLPVVRHAVDFISDKPDVVVLLQPSSPSERRAEYVREAIRILGATQSSSVVSVAPVPAHYSPDYVGRIERDRITFPPTTRRQDCAPAYYRDGTVYVSWRWAIEDGSLYGPACHPLIIPASDSVTLDTEEDLFLAEAKHG